MTTHETETPLEGAAVAEWLRANPDFFVDQPDLLAEMHIPHDTGGAVSLVERQVAVLRGRNLELRERLHKLVDVARENDQLFAKIRILLLDLLEARTVADLCERLSQGLRDRFHSEYVSLMLFDTGRDDLGAAFDMPLATAETRIASLLRNQRPVAGQLRSEEVEFLFNDMAVSVASCAVVPLSFGRPLGVLAIGSSRSEHFKSSMDTLFIGHIGDVLARLLNPLLAAPQKA